MVKRPLIPAGREAYLEGPKPRGYELGFGLRVLWEFLRGFRALHFVGPCITVFGSARFPEGHPYYEMARETGKTIAGMGFTTMTGGGPGVMEGANRGAKEAGGRSVGCNIILPFEQHPNPYLDKWVNIKFFFVRKTLLLKYSYAFFILPGGWGTMDEMYEVLTLIQTGVIHHFPVVLMGKSYYQELLDFMDKMAKEGTIHAEDLKYLKVTDDVSEGMEHIRKYVEEYYKVVPKARRPRWWLLEKA